MITPETNLAPASIYIPELSKWATVTGACLENGHFRLIWKTDCNHFGLMTLDKAQELISSFACPF